jgi:ABC-2 type transport system ATP-binding protein
LRGVTLSINRAEIFGFLGPNGGGKTTLFRILATLITPTDGTARVFGNDVVREPDAVRQTFGVVFQSPSLDKKLTAEENLLHHGHLYGLHGKSLRVRIQEMLERVGLADRARDRVEKLSGGQQRRVELAKGLLHRPQLLLLDEPSTGLDPGARRDFWKYLAQLRDSEGVTVILTTHLMEEAEDCDRLAILNHGGIVARGTPDALKAEIGGDVVTVECREPEKLCADIGQKFGVAPVAVDGTVRIEHSRGPEFLTQLIEAFPGRIASVKVGKPTLEDVFIHHTGHRFTAENEEAAP